MSGTRKQRQWYLDDPGAYAIGSKKVSRGPEAYQEYCVRHIDGYPVKFDAEKQRVIQCLEKKSVRGEHCTYPVEAKIIDYIRQTIGQNVLRAPEDLNQVPQESPTRWFNSPSRLTRRRYFNSIRNGRYLRHRFMMDRHRGKAICFTSCVFF
ncbi:hypothetical protein Leryth_022628 [Lithospermum erythrorhizon]|nr:hypothetical protein Leryth_022628 [Lithospermum erythrorhizon]